MEPSLEVGASRRRWLRALLRATVVLAIAAVVLTGVWVALTDKVSRARTYAAVCLSWETHWPFTRGVYLPLRLLPVLNALDIVTPVRAEIEPGVNLMLNPADVVDMRMLATGFWNREVWDWVAAHLSPGATFIDVGAHIGTFTIRAAKIVGPAGRVVAVEPNPITAQMLRDNVAASNWTRVVHVREAACAENPGRMTLFAGSEMNSGVASLSRTNVVDHGSDGRVSFDVEVLPLDHIVENGGLSRIDVIKIDTEGAETVVLRGARKSIRRFRPVIVLETLDSQLVNMGSSTAELEALLRELGYSKSRQGLTDAEWVPMK